MLAWLPSTPYPAEKEGYWAPVTSTLDWCEENYYATHYSAEIVNSLTNLLFISLAFKGMYNCWKHGHDRTFFITFLGYLVVGSGSFAFHSTLKYPMQLVDEFSMIYTTCLMFWATFAHNREPVTQVLLGAFSLTLAVFITGYYHYLQDPSFHQNAYAILTAIVLSRSIFIMESNLRPRWRKQNSYPRNGWKSSTMRSAAEHSNKQDARDEQILRTMWAMIAVGLTSFLGGFVLWSLDNHYCTKLRAWRHEIGLPWGLMLEGHGWWHLMTGVGAYFYIVWGIWLRHCLNGRQDEFDMIWPSMLTSLPQVKRRSTASNGALKKCS